MCVYMSWWWEAELQSFVKQQKNEKYPLSFSLHLSHLGSLNHANFWYLFYSLYLRLVWNPNVYSPAEGKEKWKLGFSRKTQRAELMKQKLSSFRLLFFPKIQQKHSSLFIYKEALLSFFDYLISFFFSISLRILKSFSPFSLSCSIQKDCFYLTWVVTYCSFQ